MLIELLKRLKETGIRKIIYTDTYILPDVIKIYDEEDVFLIDDVRSATFFAFGQAKMIGYPVALIVSELYISSAYTALTEVWFQRIPLIVIAYNSTSYQSTLYLERCVDKFFFVEEEEVLEDIIGNLKEIHGVCLIKVREKANVDDSRDYSEIIRYIKQMEYDGSIICYNASKITEGVINILPAHKYGILSKYFGYLCGGGQAALCMPDYILKYDTNSFSVRDLPSNLLIFISVTQPDLRIKYNEWIKSNGISVYENEGFINIKGLSTPTVVFCKS